MTQRCGTATQCNACQEGGAQNQGRLKDAIQKECEKVAHRRSFLAFAINWEMRSSSSCERLEASPPMRAETTFSVEPPKNVSMRCFSADCRTAWRGAVGA